jgi:hypothetical protein
VTPKALYPIPGGKWRSKYSFLAPAQGQRQMCEPFMGAASQNLRWGLPGILGEIDPCKRAIALTPSNRRASEEYVRDYRSIAADFVHGIDLDSLLAYTKQKQAMKVLKAADGATYRKLSVRWHELTRWLYSDIASGEFSAGHYSFVQRAAFGNALRLAPSQKAFNMAWHIDKLKAALNFNPEQWCGSLKDFRPTITPDWYSAITAVRHPQKCWLMLDPPYIEADGDRKMTPCYIGHKVTGDGREETYRLAVEPLREGLSRGFPHVHLFNYYSSELDADVTRLAYELGYLCDRRMLGKCSALGNSNGRLVHGERVDKRPAPIECVWVFRPFEQLTLLEAA